MRTRSHIFFSPGRRGSADHRRIIAPGLDGADFLIQVLTPLRQRGISGFRLFREPRFAREFDQARITGALNAAARQHLAARAARQRVRIIMTTSLTIHYEYTSIKELIETRGILAIRPA
jgi:hypothetical protein